MKLTTDSEVPVYTVSGPDTARPLPDWLSRKKKRQIAQENSEYAVELLQDFSFDEASQCVRISEDGHWIVSTGTYKPQIHTHFLPHLALSYARHSTATNRKFLLLSPDARKQLHLQDDRSVDFHTAGGIHYTTRIPRYGRDLKYDTRSAEALITSVGYNGDGMGEVYRLNLELGRFMRSYEVDVGQQDSARYVDPVGLQGAIDAGSVDAAAVGERSHGLLSFGTSLGTIEFFDPRSRTRIATLPCPVDAGFTPGEKIGVTCLEYDRSGLTIASGLSNGMVYLYDLRSPEPLLRKDHGNGWAIQNLTFLESDTETVRTTQGKIMSADKSMIKLWDRDTGKPWTHMSSSVDLNDVQWYPDSGMFFTANEGQRQNIFFAPTLGPAPKWCTFIDNLVEELAETPATNPTLAASGATGHSSGQIYDNYKFVTLEELKQLQMAHLVGKTSLLRPYMHGYFVAQRLYEEARLITQPTAWVDERAQLIKKRIEKDRESRIRGHKKSALSGIKTNKQLASKLLSITGNKAQAPTTEPSNFRDESEDESDGVEEEETPAGKPLLSKKQSKKVATGEALLGDDRFSRLFREDEFQIDESSYEFRAINPSTRIQQDTTTKPSYSAYNPGAAFAKNAPPGRHSERAAEPSTEKRKGRREPREEKYRPPMHKSKATIEVEEREEQIQSRRRKAPKG